MMFKDLSEGQTHFENDGCGEPAHNNKERKEFSGATFEQHHDHSPLNTLKEEVSEEFTKDVEPTIRELAFPADVWNKDEIVCHIKQFISSSLQRAFEAGENNLLSGEHDMAIRNLEFERGKMVAQKQLLEQLLEKMPKPEMPDKYGVEDVRDGRYFLTGWKALHDRIRQILTTELENIEK